MRAILVKAPGGVEQLIFGEIPDPKPDPQELLVRVKAIGVNHGDLLQRQGKYPPPPGTSEILGLEVAGTIEEVGSKTQRFKKKDRVMCLLSSGGYAEMVTVHENLVMPIPNGLSFIEAAAIPEVFLTAYQALFLIGEIQPKSWVLIHAAGSGVGTAALQLVCAAGAKAIATTRSKEKLEKCLELGAEAVINAKAERFAEKVLEITEDHGADLILDFIGAPYFEQNMKALTQGGAILFLATLGGKILETFDLTHVIKKWATLSGTTLRPRPLEYKTKLIDEFSHFALSRFEDKRLKPVIHAVLPWEEVQNAHLQLAEGLAFGKIVLQIK